MQNKFTVVLTIIGATLALVCGARAADFADASKAAKPYPLETCAVSGEKLGGDMGEPHVFEHKGQEIQLCCKSCMKDFDKDATKIMAKITEANKKVKPYKMDTCPVSGEKLGDKPHAIVYKEKQEVKFCCKDCAAEFRKNPAKYSAKLAGK
jgi:YHS domain-containing protein